MDLVLSVAEKGDSVVSPLLLSFWDPGFAYSPHPPLIPRPPQCCCVLEPKPSFHCVHSLAHLPLSISYSRLYAPLFNPFPFPFRVHIHVAIHARLSAIASFCGDALGYIYTTHHSPCLIPTSPPFLSPKCMFFRRNRMNSAFFVSCPPRSFCLFLYFPFCSGSLFWLVLTATVLLVNSWLLGAHVPIFRLLLYTLLPGIYRCLIEAERRNVRLCA